MTLAIIIPTELEGHQLIRCLKNKEYRFFQKKPFYSGSINNIPVTLTICGVGKTNSAHTTALLIHEYNPEVIINLGVAGAYPSTNLGVGDLVFATSERYIDEGLLTKNGIFISIHELGISLSENTSVFKLHIPYKLSSLKSGHFATVSTCTGSLTRGLQIVEDFGCICENMEGCAIAHICHYTDTRFIELRCVSNVISDRDSSGIDKKDLLKASHTVQSFFIENIEYML